MVRRPGGPKPSSWQGGFLEQAQVFDNYYGTPIEPVQKYIGVIVAKQLIMKKVYLLFHQLKLSGHHKIIDLHLIEIHS